MEPIRAGVQSGVLDGLLGVGDPIKPMHNYMLGCVHYFYEVEPINIFLQSLKEIDDFPKSKEPRHKRTEKIRLGKNWLCFSLSRSLLPKLWNVTFIAQG